MARTVITFGTYDLFHYGHLRIIQRAKALGDRLVVGVSSDQFNYEKKGERPAVNEDQRMALVGAIAGVDEVFLEESLEKKAEYCKKYKADVMVMGDDHVGRFDAILKGVCECVYLPRTSDISSTSLKKSISDNQLCHDPNNLAAAASPKVAPPPAAAAYSASNPNLVRASEHSAVFDFLVRVHDRYYDLVMAACTPFCRVMPREVCGVTVFTANIVTYGRGLLVVPIALAMKYGYPRSACFLILWHDFLDHLDGVVAKQQARDGRSKGDDGAYGAFVDAQMDKLVFCLCLWSFLLLAAWPTSHLAGSATIIGTSALLFGLEFTIACVRTGDYFRVKLTPQNDAKSGKSPALRAVSEGKLKQKFESVGISLYALCLPDPTSTAAFPYVVTGTICLWFAVFFSYQSLLHKLRAREKAV